MFRLKTTLKSNSRRLHQQLLTLTSSTSSQVTNVRPFALFNAQKEGKTLDAAASQQQ